MYKLAIDIKGKSFMLSFKTAEERREFIHNNYDNECEWWVAYGDNSYYVNIIDFPCSY